MAESRGGNCVYSCVIWRRLQSYMCRVFSCVVGRGCSLWPMCSLGKTLLAIAQLHYIFQGQICLLLHVFLDFLLLHSSPLEWKGHLFWVFNFGCLILPVSKSKWKKYIYIYSLFSLASVTQSIVFKIHSCYQECL